MMVRQALMLVLLVGVACAARAEDLKPIEDAELTLILNNFETLSEQAGPPGATPYIVKVLRVATDGECDGKPETCPKRRLYIAVSDFGEAPKRAVYRLSDAFGWDFEGWGKPVTGRSGHELLPVRLKRSIISPTPDKGWFTKESYEVLVSPWSATAE